MLDSTGARVRVRTQVFVFGGWDGTSCMNDHYVVDLGTSPVTTGPFYVFLGESVTWAHLAAAAQLTPASLVAAVHTVTWRWRRVAGAGDVPEERCGHSAVAVGRKIYLWGGRSTSGAYLPCDSVYAFSAGTLPNASTNHLPPPADRPTNRPTAAVDTHRWEKETSTGDAPTPRAHHSATGTYPGPLAHACCPGTVCMAVFVDRG